MWSRATLARRRGPSSKRALQCPRLTHSTGLRLHCTGQWQLSYFTTMLIILISSTGRSSLRRIDRPQAAHRGQTGCRCARWRWPAPPPCPSPRARRWCACCPATAAVHERLRRSRAPCTAGATVMKNCEPLVLGPRFAHDSMFGRSWRRVGWNSSWSASVNDWQRASSEPQSRGPTRTRRLCRRLRNISTGWLGMQLGNRAGRPSGS